MDFSDIAKTVLKAAPLLASAVGSPLAGTAIALLANYFGADASNAQDILDKINSDPERDIKLKKLELEHGENLAALANAQYALEVQDRDSARNREETQKDYTPAILAYILTSGIFFSLLYLFLHAIPPENRDQINSIIDVLKTVWIGAMAYYHGSSMGERRAERKSAKQKIQSGV